MANKNSLQISAEYWAARVVLQLLRIVPVPIAEWLGSMAGRIAYAALGKLRRVGLRNLELAFPEKSLSEREAILRGAFRNLGRVMVTVSRFGSLTPDNLSELIEYQPTPEYAAAYKKIIEDGRGKTILGGHMGNWELQAFSFPVFFEPLSFLARKMDNPRIDELVLNIRTRLGNKQIDKTNSASPILRTLRSGGAVGVLADVNSHPKEGVFVPFFGIKACTASGVAMLALRTNAAILPMFAIWDDAKRKYFIYHGEIIEPVNTGDRKRDIQETTALCVAATERDPVPTQINGCGYTAAGKPDRQVKRTFMSEDRTAQICSSCGSQFGCEARLEGCWCNDVKLADWQAEIVKAKFDDCLCPACLASFAAKHAMKITYPDGHTEIIEDAVRIDTQNFHEGMFDFYDERGNLLRQIDLGSGISWEPL